MEQPDLFPPEEFEKDKVEPQPELQTFERDCPRCGGSGPCERCDRGRALAQEQSEQKRQQYGT